MPGSLPSALALTSIPDGSNIVAADPRNNFAAVQAALNAVIAALGVTAKGDVLAATASGALSNVAAGTNGQVLTADSTQAAGVKWATPTTATTYRKTTAKAVTNTVAETDLLNGEITVAANAMSTDRVVHLSAWGDFIQNSGGNTDVPRFKLKLGAGPTTIIDTNVLGAATACGTGATRYGWKIAVDIQNLGATNSQWVNLMFTLGLNAGAVGGDALFATGEGVIAKNGTQRLLVGEGANTAAIDTTAAMAVLLTVINPTATTTETKLFGAILEVV